MTMMIWIPYGRIHIMRSMMIRGSNVAVAVAVAVVVVVADDDNNNNNNDDDDSFHGTPIFTV